MKEPVTNEANRSPGRSQEPGTSARSVAIAVSADVSVSGLFEGQSGSRACYVLAHGAGAGMRHPFLASAAEGLNGRGIASLRYQFPYMERGSKRPDPPKLAQAAVRAAVTEAGNLSPGLPLFGGGKSFGGRMTSQAQAEAPLPGVRGLIFLGFPLHRPGEPSDERAQHLFKVKVPMLFVQGERDEFAQFDLLQSVIKQLGARATLRSIPEADHSFHVPARTGRKAPEVLAELLDAVAAWIERVLSNEPSRE